MSDYISREHMLKAIEDNNFLENSSKALFSHIVNQVPAADVVPVVRCINCIHSRVPFSSVYLRVCDVKCTRTEDTDFCKYGESR